MTLLFIITTINRIMIAMIVMLSLLFLLGCGKNVEKTFTPTNPNDVKVVEEIKFYHDLFLREGYNRGHSYYGSNVKFLLTDDDRYAGYVQGDYVVISRFWWNRYNSIGKETLIFHELGHRLIGRDHLELYVADGFTGENPYHTVCVKTIMGTSAVASFNNMEYCGNFYQLNRERYIDELFGNR